MSLSADLQTYLLSKAAITNIVGTTGVYWLRAPQRVDYPFIVFFRVSTDRSEASDASEYAGYVETTYQFDCYDSGGSDALTAAEALRTTLGEIEKTTIGSTYVQAIVMDSEREFATPPDYGKEETLDRVMFEARIVYNETVPSPS